MNKGILAQPKKEFDSTAFKLVCWYNQKPNGIFYTQQEIDANKNRKYHDSIDFILTTSGNVTRHDEALNKLLHHLEKYKQRIINAWLFYNDHVNDKQYLIGTFSQDEHRNKFVQPTFRHYTKVYYSERVEFNKNLPAQFEIKERELRANHVFVSGLLGEPLKEYRLKHHKTL